MSHSTFEVPFAESEFHVTDLGARVYEGAAAPAPPLPAPIGIIRTNQDWGINIKWRTEGSLVTVLQGYWHLDVYLESVGPGPELRLPVGPPEGVDVPLTPGTSPQDYDVYIGIPAGQVPAGPGGHPQPYMLVATICYKYCQRGRIGLMSGFVEGPVIQVYAP